MVVEFVGIASLALAGLSILASALKIPFTLKYKNYCALIGRWIENKCKFDGVFDFIRFLAKHKIRNVRLAA